MVLRLFTRKIFVDCVQANQNECYIGPSLMEGEAPMAKGINVVLECQLTKLSINTTTTTSGELLPPKHSCKYVGFLLKIINKQ
jgi:hypothetical protein